MEDHLTNVSFLDAPSQGKRKSLDYLFYSIVNVIYPSFFFNVFATTTTIYYLLLLPTGRTSRHQPAKDEKKDVFLFILFKLFLL